MGNVVRVNSLALSFLGRDNVESVIYTASGATAFGNDLDSSHVIRLKKRDDSQTRKKAIFDQIPGVVRTYPSRKRKGREYRIRFGESVGGTVGRVLVRSVLSETGEARGVIRQLINYGWNKD